MEDLRCKFVAAEMEDSRCNSQYDGAVIGMEDPRCKSLLSGAAMEVGDPRCWTDARPMEDPRCNYMRCR
jgi:hypothetical protein